MSCSIAVKIPPFKLGGTANRSLSLRHQLWERLACLQTQAAAACLHINTDTGVIMWRYEPLHLVAEGS